VGRADGHRNLSFACGHGHVGMGMAPATGELLAQLITGEPAASDPAPLRIGRYGRRPRKPSIGE
jgi:D-amino-acid dehydrogenase